MRKLTPEHRANIAAALKGNKNSLGIKRTPQQIEEMRERLTGAKNPQWKGGEVSYREVHKWVSNWKMMRAACEACGLVRKLDWANVDRKYQRVLDDYIALCRSCHVKYDRRP